MYNVHFNHKRFKFWQSIAAISIYYLYNFFKQCKALLFSYWFFTQHFRFVLLFLTAFSLPNVGEDGCRSEGTLGKRIQDRRDAGRNTVLKSPTFSVVNHGHCDRLRNFLSLFCVINFGHFHKLQWLITNTFVILLSASD